MERDFVQVNAHPKARFGAAIKHVPPDFAFRVSVGVDAINFTHQIDRFFTSWVRSEGGAASWNPLNSTLWLQNFTLLPNYNSIPVRNYASPNAGVAATILTLSQRETDGTLRFGKIVNELQNNYINNRSAELMVRNCTDQINLWGTSPELMLEVLDAVS